MFREMNISQSFRTSGNARPTARRPIPEDLHLQQHRCLFIKGRVPFRNPFIFMFVIMTWQVRYSDKYLFRSFSNLRLCIISYVLSVINASFFVQLSSKPYFYLLIYSGSYWTASFESLCWVALGRVKHLTTRFISILPPIFNFVQTDPSRVSREQTPSWEAISPSTSPEIPRILWKHKFHVHESPPLLIPILSQSSPLTPITTPLVTY
jgi:hypothetical protein